MTRCGDQDGVIVRVRVRVRGCSGAAHLREHRNDAREERLALLRLVVGDHAGDAANVEQRCAFHRRAARDRVVASAVGGGGLASALRDIERDGYGCALELIADLAFTAGKLPDEVQGKGEEIDRAPVGIKVS